jgi:signal peptidase I
MEPTIQRGDRIVTDMRAYFTHVPQYRDVIVFYTDRTYFVKRVVAMGGDTIEGKKGRIFVNARLMNESYIQHSQAGLPVNWKTLGNDPTQNFGPVTVPAGKYFVLGDNRDVSLDSRSPEFGFVDRSSVIGKVLYIFSTARQGARVQ